jgi:DNA-binding GntR family transcriptional regulator
MLEHRRRSLVAEVERFVRSQIISGKFAAGSRLQQDQIAETLEMSVTPVREAFVALAGDGWIVLEPNRGAFVRPITREGVEEFAALSTFLMEFIIRRAVEFGSDSEFDRLRLLRGELVHQSTPDGIWAGIREMNLYLCEIGRTTWARTLLRGMGSFIMGSVFELLPETMGVSRDALIEMADLICDGDADAAVAICGTFTLAHLDALLAYFAKHRVIANDPAVDHSPRRDRTGSRTTARAGPSSCPQIPRPARAPLRAGTQRPLAPALQRVQKAARTGVTGT